MMNFLFMHPLFVWLLPLAGLPVLFHLFLRVPEKARFVSSLMFFLRAAERLHARKRLREWLILALRCLFIFLFLLVLARPVARGGIGGGRLAMVLLIDNSASMCRPSADGHSLLAQAVEGARRLVAAMRPEDEAAIILLVEDPAVALPPAFSSDKASLLAALSQVRVTSASGAPAEVLSRAFALPRNSAIPQWALHLFTDLQCVEWNRSASAIVPSRARPALFVHRLERAKKAGGNVAFQGLALPNRKIVAGLPAAADITLRNLGAGVSPVRLKAVSDAAQARSWDLSLAPGEDQRVMVPLPADSTGWHWLDLQLEGNDFPAGDRAGLAYNVLPRQAVVFAGSRADYGLLPTALNPSSSAGLITEFVTPSAFRLRLKTGEICLAALTWDRVRESFAASDGASDELRRFVETGGNLIILCDPSGSSANSRPPAWLDATPGTLVQSAKGLALRPVAGEPMLDDLRDEKGQVALGEASAIRYQPLNLSTNWARVVQTEQGHAIIARRSFGRGHVIACGLAFAPAWTTLPLKGAFVVLAHNLTLSAAGISRSPLLAGIKPFVSGAEETVMIRAIVGDALDWKGAVAPALPRAGVYAVTCGTNTWDVAVCPAPAEASAACLTGRTVPVLGGVDYSVETLRDFDSLERTLAQSRRAMDLAVPCLLLALAALSAEAWLANRPVRAKPAGPG